MGKNKYKGSSEYAEEEENEEVLPEFVEEKDGRTQTVYTHGKVYTIPLKDSVEDFLKKKFSAEYK